MSEEFSCFARVINGDGSERWVPYYTWVETHEEAALMAARNLRTYDVREIWTFEKKDGQQWDPKSSVTRL